MGKRTSKPTKTVVHACEYLKRQVRYDNAYFNLPGGGLNNSEQDTAAIKAATARYVETWIVPVIDAIAAGDTVLLKQLTKGRV